jgi:hypothetical protein
MSDKKDPSGADLPPESQILEIEYYMDKNANEIVDFLEEKIVEDYAPTGEIYDRLLSQVVNEFPYGKPEDGRPYYDKVHAILANALIASLWCGWVSKAMVNRKDPKFNPEYLEKFRRAITAAYDLGRKHPSQRP